jgi:hypothetical protein
MPANARMVTRAVAGILSCYSLALALRVLIESTQFCDFIDVSVHIVAIPVATLRPYAVDVIVHELNASVQLPRFPDARERMQLFSIGCVSRILCEKVALVRGRLFVYVSDIVSGFDLAG